MQSKEEEGIKLIVNQSALVIVGHIPVRHAEASLNQASLRQEEIK